MARRTEDVELDPAIVLIPDAYTMTMDEWFASLRRDGPARVTMSGAELVAEARAENE